jgi:hypothetical protein
VRTMTARKDDRFFTRVTMDDDVQEAPDDGTDSEGVEGEEGSHPAGIVPFAGEWGLVSYRATINLTEGVIVAPKRI